MSAPTFLARRLAVIVTLALSREFDALARERRELVRQLVAELNAYAGNGRARRAPHVLASRRRQDKINERLLAVDLRMDEIRRLLGLPVQADVEADILF